MPKLAAVLAFRITKPSCAANHPPLLQGWNHCSWHLGPEAQQPMMPPGCRPHQEAGATIPKTRHRVSAHARICFATGACRQQTLAQTRSTGSHSASSEHHFTSADESRRFQKPRLTVEPCTPPRSRASVLLMNTCTAQPRRQTLNMPTLTARPEPSPHAPDSALALPVTSHVKLPLTLSIDKAKGHAGDAHGMDGCESHGHIGSDEVRAHM